MTLLYSLTVKHLEIVYLTKFKKTIVADLEEKNGRQL